MPVPAINDITTTWQEPPMFWRGPRKGRALPEVNCKHHRGYYADLAPLYTETSETEILDVLGDIFRSFGFREIEQRGNSIQAVAVTTLLRFRDDVVAEVRPVANRSPVANGIHIRSASRLGRSDLGANAARIRKILDAVRLRVNCISI